MTKEYNEDKFKIMPILDEREVEDDDAYLEYLDDEEEDENEEEGW